MKIQEVVPFAIVLFIFDIQSSVNWRRKIEEKSNRTSFEACRVSNIVIDYFSFKK